MKKFTKLLQSILLVLILTTSISSYSQNWNWSEHLTATTDVQVRTQHIDNDNNLYVGGLFRGTLSFVGSAETLTSTALVAFIAKYNSDGNLQWANKIGDAAPTTIKMIKSDNSNNIWIVGEINGSAEFTSQDNINITISNTGGSWDGYIAKYYPNGNIVDARNIAKGPGIDRVNGLTLDLSGNIYISGFFRGASITFGGDEATLTYSGTNDWGNAFIAKFNSSLVYQNSSQFGSETDGGSRGAGLVWSNGAVYLAIDFFRAVKIVGTDPIVSFSGSSSTFQANAIIKFTDSGIYQWHQTAAATTSDLGTGNDVISDSDGDVYLNGRYSGTIVISNSEGNLAFTKATTGSFDNYIAKFEAPDGTIAWAKTIGSTGEERLWGSAQRNDVISIAGYFSNTMILGNSPANVSDTIISNGGRDAFMVNFDKNGNYLSLAKIGGTTNDEAYFITPTSYGNSIIGGIFASESITIGDDPYTKEGAGNNSFLAHHINIHILPTITPIINNSSAAGSIDLEIFGGGEAPYTYTLTLVGGDVVGTGTYSAPLNFTGLNGGVYRLEVADNLGRQITKFYHIFEPTITTVDPAAVLNYCEGQSISVEFEVNIPEAEAYQWLKDGVAIPGEELTTYTATEAGVYTIEVTVDGEVGISNEIEIHVEGTPLSGTLTKNPDVANVCENDLVSASLTAGSGGVEDILQYRTFDGDAWTDWADYTSESPIETVGISEVQIQTYRTNQYCDPSDIVTVSWIIEPTPVSGTLARTPDVDNVCEGTEVSATLTPGSGGNGTDELEYSTDGGVIWGAYLSGETISTAGVETVEVRTRRMADFCDPAAYSTVLWTIEPTPVSGTLARTPDVDNVCEGTEVSATLTSGSGGNGTDELEYSTDGGVIWEAYLSGETISTAGVETVEVRTRRMADFCDPAVYNTVLWTIEPTPVSGTLGRTPDVDNVCEGTEVSATLASGSGGNGTDELEYSTDDGVSWSAYVSGETISTTGFNSVEVRTRQLADYCDNSEYNTVIWQVNPPTVAGEVTGGSNICEGSTSAELTLTGYTGSVIRWEKSVDPFDTWSEIAHTQDTYTSNPLVETTRFRAVVQSGVCEVLESNYTEVEVTPEPIAGTISGDNIVCSGSGPVLTLEGYDGQIIKWSRRPEGSSTWQSTAETNATFYAPTITQSTQYRVEVDRGVCSSVFTDVFTVDVEQPTQGGEVTGGTSICEGASSEQLALANHLGDVVRWQSSVDNGSTWTDIANTTTTYTSGALAQTTQFRAVIQNGVCNEEPSLATTVTVNEYPTPTITNASSLEVCEGESISIDFSVDIDNADSYQWFKDDVEIADATQSTYTATQVGKYSVDVVLNSCLGTSNELTVSTIPNPTPEISTTDNLAFCEGEDISVGFTVDITDATSYQWMLDGAPISGATETTYTATEAGVYSVEVIVNSCSGVSNEQTVVVNPLPTVTAPDDFAVCAGESVTLNGAGADSYTWDSGVIDGELFTPSSTATYTVTGTNDLTGCSATDEVTVTVKDLPTPVIATTDNLEICSGDEVSVNFTVDITNAQAYQWLLNGSPIDGATSIEYTAVDKGTYSVEVTVDGCTGTSNELIVSTVDLPTPTISAGSSINICEGNNINVELTVDIDDADAYQWLYNGQVIGSGTQQTYTAIVSGTYSAEVVVGGCMGVSNGIIIAKIDNPRPRISTGDELTYYYGEAINVLLDADITDAEDYQWFKDDVAIVDANSASYAATEAGTYYVEVVVNGCMGVSNTIEVIQHNELNPEIFTADPLSWCADEEISVNLAVNLTTADSYQWYLNDEVIPDAITATYTAIAAGVYKVEVTLGDQTAFSNVIEVVSVPNPTPTISTTDPLSWCTESDISVLFTADITDADAYLWYNGEDPISGATLSSYTATEPGDYSVEVVVSGCAGVSNQITILQSGVLQPTLTAQGETEFCEGDDVAVPISVDITDAAYVWMLDGAEINGADQSTYTATAAGVYTVEVTQGSCSGVSNEITIVVNPVPNPVISTTDNLTWGEDEEISVTFTVDISDADAYQWLKDGANIANSIESSYTATEVGKYSVLVTKANCVGESNELTIEISTTPLYDVTFTVLNSSDDPVANAEVEIEGESPVLTNASGVATLKMPNGSYNFDVNAADYQEYQGTFTVSDEDLAVSVKLVAVGVDLDKLSQLNLFPNPFNNEIKISDPETVKRVVITNVAGQKVLDIQLNGADRINTQSLSSGVYLLRIITNDDQSATFRMVKDN